MSLHGAATQKSLGSPPLHHWSASSGEMSLRQSSIQNPFTSNLRWDQPTGTCRNQKIYSHSSIIPSQNLQVFTPLFSQERGAGFTATLWAVIPPGPMAGSESAMRTPWSPHLEHSPGGEVLWSGFPLHILSALGFNEAQASRKNLSSPLSEVHIALLFPPSDFLIPCPNSVSFAVSQPSLWPSMWLLSPLGDHNGFLLLPLRSLKYCPDNAVIISLPCGDIIPIQTQPQPNFWDF